jgi:hypothetical protein
LIIKVPVKLVVIEADAICIPKFAPVDVTIPSIIMEPVNVPGNIMPGDCPDADPPVTFPVIVIIAEPEHCMPG